MFSLPFAVATIPVPGTYLMSRQGQRPGRTNYHRGIDLFGNIGDPVKSVGPGTVEKVCHYVPGTSCCAGYGNNVLIRHSDDLFSFYAHLNAINVEEGQSVEGGTVIGEVGDTFSDQRGACEKKPMVPHLHLEMRDAARNRLDVLQILAAGGITIINVGNEARLATGYPYDYQEPALVAEGGFLHSAASESIVGDELLLADDSKSYWKPVLIIAGLAVATVGAVWWWKRRK